MKPGKIAVKVPKALMQRAGVAAKSLSQLPSYETLGVTRKAVVRTALVEGAEVLQQASAERLGGQTTARGEADGGSERMEAMIAAPQYTASAFVDAALETGMARFAEDEGHSKRSALDLRFPGRHAKSVKAAIRKGREHGLGSRGAVVRLLIEVGIVKAEVRARAEARRETVAPSTEAPKERAGEPTVA